MHGSFPVVVIRACEHEHCLSLCLYVAYIVMVRYNCHTNLLITWFNKKYGHIVRCLNYSFMLSGTSVKMNCTRSGKIRLKSLRNMLYL